MSTSLKNEFYPDLVSPPGETIREALEGLGMTQNEFSKRMGLSAKHVSTLIQGHSPISPNVALDLEKVLQVPARFWTSLDANYQEFLSRQQENVALQNHLDWAKSFPTTRMIERGWIPATKPGAGRVRSLLEYFGLAGVAEWDTLWQRPEACFRASASRAASPHVLSAWLRFGEREAQKFDGPDYDAGTFTASLKAIRGLIRNDPAGFEDQMIELCRTAGVALHLVPELPKLAVSGACFWQANRPVILLNLYHNSDDHFWFNFFHEAKHVLQCVKKRLFVDIPREAVNDEKEVEANQFAKDTLVPRADWQAFTAAGNFSRASLQTWANRLNVPAGVLVGRLQHEGLLTWATGLNTLKQRFAW